MGQNCKPLNKPVDKTLPRPSLGSPQLIKIFFSRFSLVLKASKNHRIVEKKQPWTFAKLRHSCACICGTYYPIFPKRDLSCMRYRRSFVTSKVFPQKMLFSRRRRSRGESRSSKQAATALVVGSENQIDKALDVSLSEHEVSAATLSHQGQSQRQANADIAERVGVVSRRVGVQMTGEGVLTMRSLSGVRSTRSAMSALAWRCD